MAKLSNKQHEQQQDRRLKKLENDVKVAKSSLARQKSKIVHLEKQVKALRKNQRKNRKILNFQ